jgi:hypothetical protein
VQACAEAYPNQITVPLDSWEAADARVCKLVTIAGLQRREVHRTAIGRGRAEGASNGGSSHGSSGGGQQRQQGGEEGGHLGRGPWWNGALLRSFWKRGDGAPQRTPACAWHAVLELSWEIAFCQVVCDSVNTSADACIAMQASHNMLTLRPVRCHADQSSSETQQPLLPGSEGDRAERGQSHKAEQASSTRSKEADGGADGDVMLRMPAHGSQGSRPDSTHKDGGQPPADGSKVNDVGQSRTAKKGIQGSGAGVPGRDAGHSGNKADACRASSRDMARLQGDADQASVQLFSDTPEGHHASVTCASACRLPGCARVTKEGHVHEYIAASCLCVFKCAHMILRAFDVLTWHNSTKVIRKAAIVIPLALGCQLQCTLDVTLPLLQWSSGRCRCSRIERLAYY